MLPMDDESLARLRAVIERSARTAGPAVADKFLGGGWQMTAEEFVAFWARGPLAIVSTASRDGRVHSAPIEVSLVDGVFHVPTWSNAKRLDDHLANARCSIAAWDGPDRAVIVYGTADVPASAGGAMVVVEVTPTRIYGSRRP